MVDVYLYKNCYITVHSQFVFSLNLESDTPNPGANF
jgi:hypothetical protein